MGNGKVVIVEVKKLSEARRKFFSALLGQRIFSRLCLYMNSWPCVVGILPRIDAGAFAPLCDTSTMLNVLETALMSALMLGSENSDNCGTTFRRAGPCEKFEA